MKNVPAIGALFTLIFGISLILCAIPAIAGFEDVAGEDEVTIPSGPAPAKTPAPTAPAPTKQSQVKQAPAPAAPAPTKQSQAKPAPSTPVPLAPVSTATKQSQTKPAPVVTPAPVVPAAPKVVDIKTLKFSRTITGYGYKKRNADLPKVEANIRSAMTVLLPIIQKIKDHPDGYKYKIQIIGHADGVGPENPKGDKPGNIQISLERAQNVLDFIVKNYNLSPDMFEVVGKGSSQLKNKSNPRSSENRRVVIVFAP